jgi:hypothetical protein
MQGDIAEDAARGKPGGLFREPLLGGELLI